MRLFCTLCSSIVLPLFMYAEEVILLDEGFSVPASLDAWELYSTGQGRIEVVQDPTDANNFVLRTDDSVLDSIYSKNVLSRDIPLQVLDQLVLSMVINRDAEDLHTEQDLPLEQDSQFDGIVLRLDSGELATFQGNQFHNGTVEVYLENHFEVTTLARAETLTLELHQYDNSPYPNDGVLWDNIRLSGLSNRIIAVDHPEAFLESDDSIQLLVSVFPVPEADLELTLMSGDESLGTGTFTSGSESVVFQFPGLNNELLEGNNMERLHVTDGLYSSEYFYIYFIDDEPSGLSVTVPETINEYGGWINASFQITEEVAERAWVEFFSSNPDLLSVPETRSLSAGQKQGTFRLTVKPDSRVIGDQRVTVRARLGREEVSATITIVEENSLNPILSGPYWVDEGTVHTLSVRVPAELEAPMTLYLHCDDPGISLASDTITLGPDQNRKNVELIAVNDDIPMENRTAVITATAEGVEPASIPFTVNDNDVYQFSSQLMDFLPLGGILESSISGVNRSGEAIRVYEVIDLILRDTATASETILAEDLTYPANTLELEIPVPIDAVGDQLLARIANGRELTLGFVTLMHLIDFPSTDFVYDPMRDQVYAFSGATAQPGHLQSLTPINPYSAQLGTPMYIGGGMSEDVLAITNDSQFLYVGLTQKHEVQRVDLDTLAIDKTIPLRTQYSNDPYIPLELLTLPGRPLDLVVSQRQLGSTGTEVRAYFDGTLQPDSNGLQEWSMTSSSTADEFFGFNVGDSSAGLYRARLTSNGFSSEDTFYGMPWTRAFNMVQDKDLLVTSPGLIFNPVSLDHIQTVNLPWELTGPDTNPLVESDISKSRLFFTSGNEIAVYESDSFQLLDTFTIPGINRIEKILRFGESGLAIRSLDNKLVFINSTRLVPNDETTDLGVTLSGKLITIGDDLFVEYIYRVTNFGTLTANDLHLQLTVHEELRFEESDLNPAALGNGQLSQFLDTLAPGATRIVISRFKVTGSQTLLANIRINPAQKDPDFSNNFSSNILHPNYRPAADSVNLLDLYGTCLAYDPATGRAFVGTGSEAPAGFDNRILSVNAKNGQIYWMTPLPGKPVQLELSTDGTTLYALDSTRVDFHRIDTREGIYVESIHLDIGQIEDFEVLIGTNDSLVVGERREGVRIIDDGVIRPSTLSHGNGNLVLQIPGTDLIFAHNSSNSAFDSFQYRISGDAFSLEKEADGFFYSAPTGLARDGHYAFGTNGDMVNIFQMAYIGRFPAYDVLGNDYNPVMLPELDKHRVYAGADRSIASFDSDSLLFIRKQEFPELPSAIRSLFRWGADGFLALLENGTVALVRCDLVPEGYLPGGIDLATDLDNPFITDDSLIQISGYAYGGQGIASVMAAGEEAGSDNDFQQWSASVSLQPGINQVSIVATPKGTGDPVEYIQTIIFDPSMDLGSLYAEHWAREYLQLDVLPADWKVQDVDRDGLSTYDEYLFGSHPRLIDDTVLVTASREYPRSGIMAYRRLKAFADMYRIEVSSDCRTWDASQSNITFIGEPVVTGGDSRYEEVLFSIQNDTGEAFFIRITLMNEG